MINLFQSASLESFSFFFKDFLLWAILFPKDKGLFIYLNLGCTGSGCVSFSLG